MKSLSNLLLLCCMCYWTTPMVAQIHIDADEDVGVGINTTGDSRVQIKNITNNRGLFLDQNFDSADRSYGFYNSIGSAGLGEKYGIYNTLTQNPGSDKNLFADYRFLTNLGNGGSFGDATIILDVGTGSKGGSISFIYQNAASDKPTRGSYYFIGNKGTGDTFGQENYVLADGNGKKYGMKNTVFENTNSLSSTHGIYCQSYLYGKQVGYGLFNRVEIAGSSENTKYGIYNYVEDGPTSLGNRYGIYTQVEKEGAGTNYALYAKIDGGDDYAGYFDGNVVVTGTMMDGVSDGRLKENVAELSGALKIITRLQPKSYDFKKDLNISLPQGRQYGLIAQELETVLPDLVKEFAHPGAPIYKEVSSRETNLQPKFPSTKKATDGPSFQTALEEATVTTTKQKIIGYEEDEIYKSVNYQALIPLLIGGMQEQQKQIENQEKQIEQQAKQMNELLNRIEQLEKK